MRVSIYDPGKPGFEGGHLATGKVEGDRITELEAVNGRGPTCGRRLAIMVLEGPHLGQSYVMEIAGGVGDELRLKEPFPIKAQ